MRRPTNSKVLSLSLHADGDGDGDGTEASSGIGSNANSLAASVLDTIRDSMLLINRDRKTVAINTTWKATLQNCQIPEEVEILDYIVSQAAKKETDAADRFAQVLGNQITETSVEFSAQFRDEPRLFLATLRAVDHDMYMVVLSDITDRKREETELLHGRKLEAVGQLASGIAHEINTPIQFIGDNLRFIRDSCPAIFGLMDEYRTLLLGSGAASASAEVLDELEEAADLAYLREEIPTAAVQALEGAERVAIIVKAMKSFGHPGDGETQQSGDINEMLSNALVVTQSELKYVADSEVDFAELPSVTCFVGDMNQVALNLFVNAAHAMADKPERGLLSVSTSVDGPWVVIRVSDTGTGIAPEVLDRIFDPFFTTKEVGKGTGQGLAITHSIINDRHGGSITVESEPSVGTTFELRIPIAGKSSETDSSPDAIATVPAS